MNDVELGSLLLTERILGCVCGYFNLSHTVRHTHTHTGTFHGESIRILIVDS